MKKFYTTKEVADLTGKDYTYIAHILRLGYITGETPQKLGRSYMIDRRLAKKLVKYYKPENLDKLWLNQTQSAKPFTQN